VTLRKEREVKVFGNRMLRRIFGTKRDEETRGWRSGITRIFIICTPPQILLEGAWNGKGI
jgi:hypothetical protein